MSSSKAVWRKVPGWFGYIVSDQGQVKGPKGLLKGNPNKGRGEYLYVNLSNGPIRRRVKIAVLVLEAFVGPRPKGLHACHNNGNATDDRLANLRWDTPRENQLDIVRHGRNHEANKTHCPAGHELIPENLVQSKLPKRICRICENTRFRKRRTYHDGNDELKG